MGSKLDVVDREKDFFTDGVHHMIKREGDCLRKVAHYDNAKVKRLCNCTVRRAETLYTRQGEKEVKKKEYQQAQFGSDA